MINKVISKIKYLSKPKLKVENVFFGDRVFVLETERLIDGFRLVKETRTIKDDVLYIEGIDLYCLDTGETLPSVAQGFLISMGKEAIKDYDIPLKKFVDADKILLEDLEETRRQIVKTKEYKEVKEMYKKAYKNRGFDV